MSPFELDHLCRRRRTFGPRHAQAPMWPSNVVKRLDEDCTMRRRLPVFADAGGRAHQGRQRVQHRQVESVNQRNAVLSISNLLGCSCVINCP